MRRLGRFVPAVRWLADYKWSELRYDIIAGVVVSALVVPKALGYAGIAQVPVENGLYAAFAGAVVYGIFGTSRQISTGPSSALAAVAASAVIATRLGGQQAAELVAAVTLMAALLFLIAAVFRLGWVSQWRSIWCRAALRPRAWGTVTGVTVAHVTR